MLISACFALTIDVVIEAANRVAWLPCCNPQVLRELPAELGILVELTVEKEEIYRMARNYRDMAKKPYAKNLHFEDIKGGFRSHVKPTLDHLKMTELYDAKKVIDVSQKREAFAVQLVKLECCFWCTISNAMHPFVIVLQSCVLYVVVSSCIPVPTSHSATLAILFAMQTAMVFDLDSMPEAERKAYRVEAHITEGKHNKDDLRQLLYDNPTTRQMLEVLAQFMEYDTAFPSVKKGVQSIPAVSGETTNEAASTSMERETTHVQRSRKMLFV